MSESKKIFTTPKIRKFARELGANISKIEGSARAGRITEEDVKNFISNQLKVEKILKGIISHQTKLKMNIITRILEK